MDVVIGTVLVAALLGLGTVYAERRFRRARIPEGGWGGFVLVDGRSLLASPSLRHTAPQVAKMLPRPHLETAPDLGAGGWLSIGDGKITFRPTKGRAAPWARPFTITRSQVEQLHVREDRLFINLRGEPHPVTVRAARPDGLAPAAARFHGRSAPG